MTFPPLHSFRVFESVARLGSVTAAAAELEVTAGAVSQQIKVLQSQLGVELLMKQGRNLLPTESGRRLQGRVARAFGEISNAVLELDVSERSPYAQASLTLSLPPAHGIGWLTTQLFEYMASQARIELKVITAPSFSKVDWQRADVAVIQGAPPWEGFWWTLLHEKRMTPVCSPLLMRGKDAIRNAADLRKHRLLHDDDGSQWSRWLREAGCASGPTEDVCFDDAEWALQAARDGFGIALSDELVSCKDLEEGRLIRPLNLSIPTSVGYYCLCPKAKRERSEIGDLVEWLETVTRQAL